MENKQLFEKQANSYNPFFPLVRLEDIIETISDKSIQWILNNYNHLYVEYSESKAITRNKVPALLRRKGLWITYNVNDELITEYFKGDNKDVNNYVDWTHDENWERFDKLNFVDGSITYQHLSEAVKQLLGSGNTITNYPDDEDLTVKDGTLKLKDRDYDVANFSGLGHIILRKNIMVVDKKLKNILTQDMINKENTIYEIRYDFDLNGQEITIPEGCVLDFQGGSLSNGVIISNNTRLWNPILKEVELYGKIYNTFGQEISHYNWDVIDHKCKLFTYIIPWNNIISDVQAAYSIGITNFYAILHITSNENSKFSIKDSYYVSDEYFVNKIKKYNIHVPYLKLHIDEGINMRNSPYNSSSYVNNVVAYIKQLVTSYKNMGLTFEKVWVSNEHLPLTEMNSPVEELWRDKLLDLQIWLKETIGAECWASLQQPALCIASRNDINISTNYYPRISSLETNEFYTSQISDMLCRQLESYTNNMPKQKEYIISECGCSGRPFSLAVPEHYSLTGDGELYRLRIFYNTIVDAINKHGNISSFCLFYIEVFTAHIEFRKDIYNILKKLR